MAKNACAVVVMGGSAGSMKALSKLLPVFPANYPLPIVIVQHLHPLQDGYYLQHFDRCCALTVKEADEKEPVNPGADVFAPCLAGVILTGANHDGASGLGLIKKRGGLAIVQDPDTAESPYMPRAAIEYAPVDYVLPLQRIGELLLEIPRKITSAAV